MESRNQLLPEQVCTKQANKQENELDFIRNSRKIIDFRQNQQTIFSNSWRWANCIVTFEVQNQWHSYGLVQMEQ